MKYISPDLYPCIFELVGVGLTCIEPSRFFRSRVQFGEYTIPTYYEVSSVSDQRTRYRILNLLVVNGPEYISGTLQNWAERAGIALMYIQPGNPQQNAYIERYNRTVRTEWLGRYHFDSIEDVQDHATRWLWTYNNERPNMGIGGITPIQKLRNAA